MVKNLLTVESVSEKSQHEMIAFLKRHEDYSLFLLGNFEAHGFKMTDTPNSGNFKLIRQSGEVVGVFCLAKRGTLLVQAKLEDAIFDVILESCKKEEVTIRGVIGEWNFCSKFWNFLKRAQVIKQDTFISQEILYTLDLAQAHYPKEERVRLLTPNDYTEWRTLNSEYISEQNLPSELDEDGVRLNFLWKTGKHVIWGLFIEGKLISIAELNAKALDLGQVGGVFTSLDFRRQGLSKALMKQLIMDAKEIQGIRKLIIFTDEQNIAARKVYESLGVKPVGTFALLFGM